jgi:hypothetical protein
MHQTKRNETKSRKDLGGDERKVSGIGAGLGAAFAPIDEAEGVVGVAGHAEGVDEAGGEHRLLEAVGAALAIEAGEEEADGAEIVAGMTEGVEELAELGALHGGRLAPLHPREEAAEHAELRLRHFHFSSEVKHQVLWRTFQAEGETALWKLTKEGRRDDRRFEMATLSKKSCRVMPLPRALSKLKLKLTNYGKSIIILPSAFMSCDK